jgi:hypothetical protein
MISPCSLSGASVFALVIAPQFQRHRLTCQLTFVRGKCSTRQRCQVAFRTLAAAALMPSWLSPITSFTPRRPRRFSLRWKLGPEGLCFRGADHQAQRFALAVGIHAHRNYHGHA